MSARLEFSDKRFVLAGRSYPGVPLLVGTGNQFIEPVCDYLRQSVIKHHIKTSSARTYAEHIRLFWHFLEKHGLDWETLNDHDLLRWQNDQAREGVSVNTIAARCDTVFGMYIWFELNGHVRHSIRIPGWNDDEPFKPRLSAVPAKSSKRRRGRSYGLVSGIRPRTASNSAQPTPTTDQVSRLYIAAENPSNPALTERNHLLLDWYVQTGTRRAEWGGLVIGQIPDWGEIYTMLERGEAYELKLVRTKGGRVRHVSVLPHLLEKTREYIEGTRTTLIKRFQVAKGAAYKSSEEIFLSEKTGQPLALRAITNMVTGWFKKADVKGHGHRLRAAFLTNLLEAEIAAEELRILNNPGSKSAIDYEFVLRRVAERAGHASIEYLRPYLVFVRKRRLREQDVDEYVTLQQKIEAKRHELAVLENRIKTLNESTTHKAD